MTRLLWALVAVVLCLVGYYLSLYDALAWVGFVVLGVGLGIGAAVLGSLLHDALARTPGERL
ncbi:MAG: hypothetical protein M3O87_06640 [Candidatus Dormibacteraeota bacterium]|nr:hypothetical protein [Candidatus Dormibacteraeota bacterium]